MLIPKNRHEYFLAVISGNDYPTFLPKTREEQYLAKLAGREVDVPTPKTPKERAYYNIINDIKFDPENRWQTFVAAANDDSITAPTPRTREEIWWANISLSREVIVEYVGTLPTTLQTVEGYLESYKIYGNTVQDGTPTPENPIVPIGCAERTENLLPFDDKNFVISTGGSNLIVKCKNGSLNMKGTTTEIMTTNANWKNNFTFELKAGTYYCNSPSPLGSAFGRYIKKYDDGSNILGANEYTFTITENTKCYLSFYIYNKVIDSEIKLMLNTGSTPRPYEPYGYKLPLTVNGAEYPIYLGEAEATRRIKKLVLTGGNDENWFVVTSSTNDCIFRLDLSDYPLSGIAPISTHYTGSTSDLWRNVGNNEVTVSIRGLYSVAIHHSGLSGVADWKAFLAAQYGAGTPVIVWYVLAEPETTIVNESLMKIGDYADTIDSTQTAVQIPTAAGTTIIDYDGELKPDKVELTYKTIKKPYISADDKVYQDPNGQLLGG